MADASTFHRLSRALASAFLATDYSRDALTAAAQGVLQSKGRRVAALVSTALIPERAYPPTQKHLARFIRSAPIFPDVVLDFQRRKLTVPLVLTPEHAAPLPPLAGLELPRLTSPAELADWLEVPSRQLDWLADAQRRNAHAREPSLHHYTLSWRTKRSGSHRLIESPKVQLKNCQRRILREILDKVPAHPAAHGFVKGRSCVTGAAPHAGEEIVVTADLKDFFLTVPVPRVYGIFRSLGYPSPIARLLTGLTSTVTPPPDIPSLPNGSAQDRWQAHRYFAPHLPQGAPTSPALANLCAWRLDVRLRALAYSLDAAYTRYADDLAFSGGDVLSKYVHRLLAAVRQVAADEGFRVNERKIRIMRRGRRQTVTGVVVNERVNGPRDEYDLLKAMLTNCVRHGPASQNRDGHPRFWACLTGRVGWVATLNPARGNRLEQLLGAIEWPALKG